MTAERLPPAQPAYILRGHTSQVHAVCFAHSNSRLLTGDADGWVICWSLAYKRPTVAWKAHEKTVLGLAVWGTDRVITHGRDNKLVVWKLGVADESALDNVLPADCTAEGGRIPEVVHSLFVNTMNFCSFAWCRDEYRTDASGENVRSQGGTSGQILITVPHSLDSDGVDIYNLPSERRLSTIPASKTFKTGMVMALNIHSEKAKVQVIAGYESGHTTVFALDRADTKTEKPPSSLSPQIPWQTLYLTLPHSQPILSLSTSPSHDYYITSSADAILAKHPLPSAEALVDPDTKPLKLVQTKHSHPLPSGQTIITPDTKPLKLLQTKHSGQQGLSIRSDGKIFATAGWDGRVRVYSVKTMKEVAVLKWHKDGCFATAFADIGKSGTQSVGSNESEIAAPSRRSQELVLAQVDSPISSDITPAQQSTTTISQRRDLKAQTTHWLAAGSKDGKVSLWDIF